MKKIKSSLSIKNVFLLWIIGIAGQLCWNLENQWFNMYIYKYFGYDLGTNIITGMIIFSSIATAISTFLFGIISDNVGKRKPFIVIGYILWGVFTCVFAFTNKLVALNNIFVMIVLVVLADSIMSFFGSMGNDSGFNAWTSDILNEDNKKHIGIAIACQPVIGTIGGTIIGGMIVNSFLGYIGFFTITGIIISIIGLLTLLMMKEERKTLVNNSKSFFRQLKEIFNFKDYFKIKELVLVNVILSLFFIGFNCFFNYIGNLFVYNYGFNEATFGYIEGVALIVAIIIMIIFINKMKANKDPLIIFIAIISEVFGLLLLTMLSKNHIYDNDKLLSLNNLFLFFGVIIIGFGYVTFMQTIMTWMKSLYPEDQRGHFEGIRIINFVLIPMIFSGLISNVIIKLFGEEKEYFDSVAQVIVSGKVPNESLFIVAIIFMLLCLIPLYFVNKKYNERKKGDKDGKIQNC